MQLEIAALDLALDDDIDPARRFGAARDIAADAFKSAIRLPYAGVIRRVSGAQTRQKAYELAVVAGVARRGFLKGASLSCVAPVSDTGPTRPTTLAAAP